MAVSAFRRNTTATTKKTGGKGGRGNWRERFSLPKTAPTPFILIRGNYEDPAPDPDQIELGVDGKPQPVITDYFRYRTHKRRVGQEPNLKIYDSQCSRGWDPHQPQPCVGCAYVDAGDPAFGKGAQDMVAIGLVHLALYHRHPLIDKQKGPITKTDGSGPVFVESECTGKTCNFCKYLAGQPLQLRQNDFFPQYNPADISWVFGARRYMELGKGHLGDLGEWDKQALSTCGGTKWARDAQGQYIYSQAGQAIPMGRCNNQLNVDGYTCPNCNTLLIDADADPRPANELEQIALKKYPCHVCQRHVMMKELNSCDFCGPTTDRGGQCKVEGIFEGVCWGQRQGEQTQSHLVLTRYQSIEEFESSLSPEIRGLIGKSLGERVKELLRPYDFSELYKPRSLADQAKRLEVQLPAQYSGYAQQQAQQNFAQPAFQAPGAAAPQQQFQQPYGAPAQQGYAGAPAPQQGGFAAPQQPQGFTPYATPTGPGPAPFVPPTKPNFGQ